MLGKWSNKGYQAYIFEANYEKTLNSIDTLKHLLNTLNMLKTSMPEELDRICNEMKNVIEKKRLRLFGNIEKIGGDLIKKLRTYGKNNKKSQKIIDIDQLMLFQRAETKYTKWKMPFNDPSLVQTKKKRESELENIGQKSEILSKRLKGELTLVESRAYVNRLDFYQILCKSFVDKMKNKSK